ncbi:MAG: NapH/MauN family ferredoxin-type protein [Campylobacter sputorum]|uniref:NapH/MauN family ferredoxin-type protein n=1 Tax=Campylobacter sputorum TaxID=206 RepID=UPI000B78AC2C|nr:NapH/MauN family ferredoxin-type protein [Campylobacter sputorum]ASM38098.1 menaquinol dehydrogenase NosGH, membrane component NosH [Campylobacter sputorum bv. paraureolyticus LMG 11764]MDY6121246.1 NapH/MauN family ferredoxin-type protein [Campylobacter sputorum]
MDKYNNRETLKKSSFFSTFISTKENGKKTFSLRAYRYFSVILIHILFLLSYYVDIQILEGSISGSRILGFHLADPFLSLEVIFAHKQFPINLIIGSITILSFYFIFGGRAFCSWVCPYGIVSEIGEKINSKLIEKKIIKPRKITRKIRYFIWAFFLISSFFSAILVFEIFNVVGIFSRFIIYGFSFAFFWVVIVFLVEVFFYRRFWCACMCPLGTTYSLIASKISLTKISWNKDKCDHCGVCIDVCFVGDILELTKKNSLESKDKNKIKFNLSGIDCTMCGRCVDVCHHDALKFENKIKDII